MGWSGRAPARQQAKLARGAKDEEHAMSQTPNTAIAVIGIDIGKNSFHVVGHDARGAIVLRQKWSRGRPYSKGQKNDSNDADAIAEAVQRPTMKFVATKTAEQLDLQALHRVRDMGCAGQDKELGTLRAQILDRSRQEAVVPQRAGDRACQQACPDRLGGAG
jgi:hypothetical protein